MPYGLVRRKLSKFPRQDSTANYKQQVGSELTKPLVYVIVLNWNRKEDTLACLASLQALDYKNKRLLLVDNGSVDGTIQAVARQYPEVEILRNEKNLGFAAGNNVGIRYALAHNADYVFLLNNDTEIAPTALSLLVETALKHNAGIVIPKIYYHADPQRIWSIGGMRNRWTLEMTQNKRGQRDIGLWEQEQKREHVVGCAMLLSRELLTTVGLLDERFFMYYEDSDLSLRAQKAGFSLYLSPQAHVWHKVAVSSGGSDSPNERYWMARSSVRYFRKHVRGAQWFIVIPYRTGSAVKTLFRLLIQGKKTSAQAYLRGLRDGIRQHL